MDPTSPQPQPGTAFALAGRAIAFLAVFLLMQLGWQALRGTAFERVIVHDATVRPAAFLVNKLTPDVRARAVGFTLQAPGGGLNILNGCEGMEALLLLITAFIVAPLPRNSRSKGLLLGALLVFAVNQARILTLFYAYRTDHNLFDSLHALVMPIAVILAVAGYFYAWLVHASPSTPAAS